MIILVTGSRAFNDHNKVEYELRKVLFSDPWEKFEVVHGDCPTGADAQAAEAVDRINEEFHQMGWPPVAHTRMPANWTRHGKAAGPIRNKAMVEYVASNPDKKLCLSFWETGELNKGTRNCVAFALEAGIQVERFWN
jgi:flavin-binding protein dodecin